MKRFYFGIVIAFSLVTHNVGYSATLEDHYMPQPRRGFSFMRLAATAVMGYLCLSNRLLTVRAEPNRSPQSVMSPNENLRSVLSKSLGVDISENGENFFFQGTPEFLKEAYTYLEDYDQIREDFTPFSPLYEKVKAKKEPCQTKLDFFTSLGLDPDEFRSINIGDLTDTNSIITLPFQSRFDKKTVSAFEDYLMSVSPFTRWLLLNEPGFRTDNKDYITYDFSLAQDYLCGLLPKDQPTQKDFESGIISLPTRWIVRHLIGAASSDVTLH